MAKGRRVEITASVIVHATEDSGKILGAISDAFGVRTDAFKVSKTTGHFENPIMVCSTGLTGADARQFLQALSSGLSDDEIGTLAGQVWERTTDSRFHLRIDKQALVRDGQIEVIDMYGHQGDQEGAGRRDAIKIKIHTPIYNKRDAASIFEEVLRCSDSGVHTGRNAPQAAR